MFQRMNSITRYQIDISVDFSNLQIIASRLQNSELHSRFSKRSQNVHAMLLLPLSGLVTSPFFVCVERRKYFLSVRAFVTIGTVVTGANAVSVCIAFEVSSLAERTDRQKVETEKNQCSTDIPEINYMRKPYSY